MSQKTYEQMKEDEGILYYREVMAAVDVESATAFFY